MSFDPAGNPAPPAVPMPSTSAGVPCEDLPRPEPISFNPALIPGLNPLHLPGLNPMSALFPGLPPGLDMYQALANLQQHHYNSLSAAYGLSTSGATIPPTVPAPIPAQLADPNVVMSVVHAKTDEPDSGNETMSLRTTPSSSR